LRLTHLVSLSLPASVLSSCWGSQGHDDLHHRWYKHGWMNVSNDLLYLSEWICGQMPEVFVSKRLSLSFSLSLSLYGFLNPKFWSDAKFVQILRLCECVYVCGWRGRDHFTPKMWQLHKSIPSGWTWGTRGGRGYHGDGRIQETRDDIKECINRAWKRER